MSFYFLIQPWPVQYWNKCATFILKTFRVSKSKGFIISSTGRHFNNLPYTEFNTFLFMNQKFKYTVLKGRSWESAVNLAKPGVHCCSELSIPTGWYYVFFIIQYGSSHLRAPWVINIFPLIAHKCSEFLNQAVFMTAFIVFLRLINHTLIFSVIFRKQWIFLVGRKKILFLKHEILIMNSSKS